MSRAETLPPCSDYCAWETQPAAAPPSAEGGGCEGGSAKGEAAAALRAATAARKAAAAAMPPPPPKRLAMVWGVSETTRHTVRALLRARGGWAFTRDPRQPGVALQPKQQPVWTCSRTAHTSGPGRRRRRRRCRMIEVEQLELLKRVGLDRQQPRHR